MCNFFSAISDGHGKVAFFKVEDIVKQMAIGNPKNYEWNSHASIATFFGMDEDICNKWEYKPEKSVLTLDQGNAPQKDDADVLRVLKKYLKDKDVLFLRNLYGKNSGNRNSGDRNSGNRNSGNWNSGNRNSGDLNSGNLNSGNLNSGNLNSGNRNSGDRNSGDLNSGTTIGHFCSEKTYLLFNKKCTGEEASAVYNLAIMGKFHLTEWINEDAMTDEEKEQYGFYNIVGGYLKTYDYKEAWKNAIEKATPEEITQIKALANFDADVFEQITGQKI